MSSRQKVTIAATAMCLVAVVAVVAIIAVFAATQQTFTSNINVSYTVEDVMATVSAKYYGGKNDAELTGTAMTTTGADGGESELTFDAGEEAREGATLSPKGEIKLDSKNKFVVFEYKFVNNGERDFNASMTFTGTLKNVEVYVETNNDTQISTTEFNGEDKFQTPASPTGELDTNKTFSINAKKVNGTDTTEDAHKTVYIYVKVAIINIKADAAFSGSFAWKLEAVAKPAV